MFGRFEGRPGFAPFEDEAHETARTDVPRSLSLRSFFAECFVGDTVNLMALSNALNVPRDFLTVYVFEHGLGGVVADIQAVAPACASENTWRQCKRQQQGKQRSPFFFLSRPLCTGKDSVLCEKGWDTNLSWCSWSNCLSVGLMVSPETHVMCDTMVSVWMSMRPVGLWAFSLGARFASVRDLREVDHLTYRDSGSAPLVVP